MIEKCKGICPTELAESLTRVYSRFAGDKASVLRKEIREKFGWDVFGGFTVVFQMFVVVCRAKGHNRQTRRQLFRLLKSVAPSRSEDLNAKSMARKIGALVTKEIDLYRAELVGKYSDSQNFPALKEACDSADWRRIGIWLLIEGEHKQLKIFAQTVPAFEWGFWK